MRQRLLALWLFASASMWTLEARAAGPLGLDIEPVLGPGTPAVDGWMSAQVRLENHTKQAVRGTLSVEAEVAWARGSSGPHNGTDVPFSVAPRSQVSVEVPVHGFPGMAPSLSVAARALDGQLLAEAKSGEMRTHDPLLFDLSSPSHIAPPLRTIAVALSNTR